MDSIHTVDAILLVILGIATIAGAVKGLVRQVIELAGIVASFILAMVFAGWLAEMLRLHTPLPYSPSLVIAFLALLVAGIFASHGIALGVQKVVRMTFLGWFDRLCGAALGLVVGSIVCSLLVSMALELPISPSARENIKSSSVGLFVRPIAPRIFDAVFSHGTSGIDFDSIFKGGSSV